METSDVCIVGGGPIGLSLAAALGHAGIQVDVIDRDAPAAQLTESHDGRTTAIAFGSQQLLAAIGIWPRLAADAEPIREIRVADGRSSLFLHFDSREVGDAPFGWILENRLIRKALFERVAELPTVNHLAPATVESHTVDAAGATVKLADGSERRAKLLVGADGRNSQVRARAGIKTIGWGYEQTAIVCIAAHEQPHDGIAVEHFLPPGPFAILPMTDAPANSEGGGTHRSSIVWTDRPEAVKAYLDLDQAGFDAELQQRFGPYLGKVHLVGRRFAYPLSLQQARRFTAPRVALVGEAAHAIHPIAGQGLNLGMRGVALLAELIVDHRRLGLDVGAPSLLETFAHRRRPDAVAMSAATDILDRLFSNDIPPIAAARRLGLATVGHIPPLKRFFMRYAMGAGGKLPRLVRGETL